MAEPICEDEGLLQEWTPQTQLLQQIPLKVQKGLFPQNLNLTCLDVLPEYIALGTNLGFIYWYYRVNGELQKLQLENSHCAVTCIKVLTFFDYMVAAGTDQGTVTIFQIPKPLAGSELNQTKGKQKKIERFTINGLHCAPITCLEWSQNEINIFSGDKNGVVVVTEIDSNLHICKSMAILNEKFEITQLSYAQKILLISTVFRSIICDCSNKWKVLQVGTKERKILGKFGATFCNYQHGLVLYASRPGHRLWLADKNGVVQQTLIFKSAVRSSCPEIQLINPVIKKEPFDTSFGKVIQYGDNKLLTYNSEILYILHPGAVSVVSVLNSARKILDLSVSENEIFILEGERSLLRLSPLPDRYTPDLYQPISRSSFNLDEFAAKIKDKAVESLKNITKDLITKPEGASPNSPPALADEALELPAIVSVPTGVLPTIYTDEIEIHSSVENNSTFNDPFFKNTSPSQTSNFLQDCHEEIITRPLRKRNNKKSKSMSQSQELMSDNISNSSDDRLVWGIANNLSLSESTFSQSNSSFSVLYDIPTLLNEYKSPSKTRDVTNEDIMKTSDNKSQTSLDTCESVSERLLLSSEMFREEQEKTFARLANQSLFDSFNSERTDNMSISVNMTSSSSFSSKISENLHSPSCTSENSGIASRAKSTDSQTSDNFQNEPFVKEYWRSSSNVVEENSSQEDRVTGSTESSLSSRNSQRERLYPRWSAGDVAHCSSEIQQDTETSQDSESMNKTFENNEASKIKIINDDLGFVEDNCTCLPDSPKGSQPTEFPKQTQISPQTSLEINGLASFQEQKSDIEAKAFSSLEPLNYGPPSGSSLLSSQPSSAFSSMQDTYDYWLQYRTPNRITSLSAAKNYVVCSDINNEVYYSNLSGLALSWTLLDYKASFIRVSNDGSMVWLLHKKIAVALVNPSPKSPVVTDLKKIADNVRTFAIDSMRNEGLIVTLNGKIMEYDKTCQNVSESYIPCDYEILDIAYAEGIIFAITNNNAVLCKTSKEESFRMIKTVSPITSHVAFGPGNLLWTVNQNNGIVFSDDYLNENPHWWEVHISDYIYQNFFRLLKNSSIKKNFNDLKRKVQSINTMIVTSENSVWVYDKKASYLWVNKVGITGYAWNKVSLAKLLPSIQWQKLCAEGIFDDHGRIWLLSIDGNIFCLSSDYQNFQSIPVPSEEKILCMASSTDVLWVLCESGRIYSRVGLTNLNISGCSWTELKSPLIDNLRLVWISCGCDVSWACDIHGRTFISKGTQNHTPPLNPVWQEVEGRPKDVLFQKVFVGAQLHMVWAIDNKGNLYVREGIFADYQIGTSWVYVCGVEAAHLTISGTSVWALTSDGNIYRRCGVTENNYIGDYWKSIPGTLISISSSYTDELWGISEENKIMRFTCNLKVLNGNKLNEKPKNIYSSKEDISWEIV